MRIYVMRLKSHIRDKGLVFWTFLYPLLLGTFFYLGFGTLSQDSILQTTPVYLASDVNQQLVTVMEDVKINEETPLFTVNQAFTTDELDSQLQDNEISHYITEYDGVITLHINENGLDQTIIKPFLDEYIQTNALMTSIALTDGEKLEAVSRQLSQPQHYLDYGSETKLDANKMIIYFYALIAMACLFGTFWGTTIINDIQPNQSTIAARVNVTPTHKFKLIITYVLAALTLHFLSNLILLAYLKFVLKIHFADQMGLIVLVMLLGTISGIALGAFLSGVIKGSSGLKEGLMTAVSLLLSFLSGLMMIDVKYLVTKHAPILGYINPANLITESLYSLYYYDSLEKYFFNLRLLGLLSIILIILTYIVIRGKKYDSI